MLGGIETCGADQPGVNEFFAQGRSGGEFVSGPPETGEGEVFLGDGAIGLTEGEIGIKESCGEWGLAFFLVVGAAIEGVGLGVNGYGQARLSQGGQ
jgi:hypothetical protein